MAAWMAAKQSTSDVEAMTEFLAGRTSQDGRYVASEPRGCHHDESDYDRQYGVEAVDEEALRREAGRLMDL